MYSGSYTTRSRGGPSGAGLGCLIVLLAAVVVFFFLLAVAPYYTTQFWWGIRAGMFFFLPVAIIVVLGGLAAVAGKDNPTAGLGLGFLAFAAFVGSVIFWAGHGYFQDQVYAQSVTISHDPVPDLAVRSPFNVAERQAPADLGTTVGDVQPTMYLPDQRKFGTLVAGKGWSRGYKALLVQSIGDTGRNDHQLCTFSPAATRSFGGLWSSSLGRLINEQQRFVNWDDSDAYGYCDTSDAANPTPMVVVPLKQQTGLFIVTHRPAGVALYNGRTGKLDIITDVTKISKIPGPTYPLSLAGVQRQSVQAVGGSWWDYVQNRLGYELPADLNEINSDNIGEYVLATQDGNHPQYVTMVTPRGGNTSIAAIATTPARLGAIGELAPITFHQTSWLSPESIEQTIRAKFGPVFTAQPGATIAELAPTDENHWVATIGLPQNMLYRVRGDGALKEPLCLYQLDGAQIACGQLTNFGGFGPGVAVGQSQAQYAPSAGGVPGAVPAPASSDLHGLPTPQLVDLINRADAELASRAGR